MVTTADALTLTIWNADGLPENWVRALAIVFFLFAAPFLVLTHELGHLLTALALGWRVPILGGRRVLRLRFSPLRFSAGAPPFAGASGAIVAVPPAQGGGRAGWIAVHAGGPASDLLVATLAASVALSAPVNAVRHDVFQRSRQSPRRRRCSTFFAPAGAAAALRTGCRSWPIWPDATSSAVAGARRGCSPKMIDGKRPRDWDIALVRAVEADAAWTGNSDGALYVYMWHLDRAASRTRRAQRSRGRRRTAR